MSENKDLPDIRKKATVIRNTSEEARLRERIYQREKRLHVEATALGHAEREGFAIAMLSILL